MLNLKSKTLHGSIRLIDGEFYVNLTALVPGGQLDMYNRPYGPRRYLCSHTIFRDAPLSYNFADLYVATYGEKIVTMKQAIKEGEKFSRMIQTKLFGDNTNE